MNKNRKFLKIFFIFLLLGFLTVSGIFWAVHDDSAEKYPHHINIRFNWDYTPVLSGNWIAWQASDVGYENAVEAS